MRHIRNLSLTFAVLGALAAIFAGPALAVSPPVNQSKPLITGTSQVEYTLTSSKGKWSENPTSYKYQWLRCDSAGANCSAIGAATGSSYMVEEADQGHTLGVEVTASNSAGSGSATAQSAEVVKTVKRPEFVPSSHQYPDHFEFSGGAASISWTGSVVACNGASGSGSITGPDQVSVTKLTITGCFVKNGLACTTIESTPLHGHFGYINEATKSVGLILEPAPGSLFSSFKCQNSQATVVGAVIAKITPVNTTTSSFTLAYAAGNGLQNPDKFEQGPVRQLEWTWLGRTEDWGFGASTSFTTNEAGKIIG
jgi:hypothetical protein